MPTLDLYAPDFPHGSPQGYNDGCRSNPVCQNYGSDSVLTCKEAALARTTVHGLNRKPIDAVILKREIGETAAPVQLNPPARTTRATPNPRAVTHQPPAAKPAVKVSEPAEIPGESDPHDTMTDKEKDAHYNAGCRETPCRERKSILNKIYSDRRKARIAEEQAAAAAAAQVTPDSEATVSEPAAPPETAESTPVSLVATADTEPAEAVSATDAVENDATEPEKVPSEPESVQIDAAGVAAVDYDRIRRATSNEGARQATAILGAQLLEIDGAGGLSVRDGDGIALPSYMAEDPNLALQLEQTISDLSNAQGIAEQTGQENDALGEALLDLQRTLDAERLEHTRQIKALRADTDEAEAWRELHLRNYQELWLRHEALRNDKKVDESLARLEEALPDKTWPIAPGATVTISIIVGGK